VAFFMLLILQEDSPKVGHASCLIQRCQTDFGCSSLTSGTEPQIQSKSHPAHQRLGEQEVELQGQLALLLSLLVAILHTSLVSANYWK
jgi:hypothetical protein